MRAGVDCARRRGRASTRCGRPPTPRASGSTRRLDRRAGRSRGDPARLQQVFWNLLSNASSSRRRGGRGHGRARRGRTATVEIDGRRHRRRHRARRSCRTCSSGSGRRTRRPRARTAASAWACRSSSTWSSCTAAPSAPKRGEGRHGATFSVDLPLAAARREERRATGRALATPLDFDPIRLTGRARPVVDDEPTTRETEVRARAMREVASATRRRGAGSVREAHVIISDIGMPDKDGYDFIREVRALLPAEAGKVPHGSTEGHAPAGMSLLLRARVSLQRRRMDSGMVAIRRSTRPRRSATMSGCRGATS